MLGWHLVSKRELARLERELSHALKRAASAEQSLAAEREAKDRLVIELASRVVTKHGGYGLTGPVAQVEPPPPNPRGFTHEPSEIDLAKLEYYKQCARAAGRSELEAESIWEAEMRGEPVRYDYADENADDRLM